MNKQEALYFLEGLAAGIAAPSAAVAKELFALLAKMYGISAAEMDPIREEIDVYLNEAEQRAS